MKRIFGLILLFTTICFAQQFKFAWLSDIHVGYLTAVKDLERSVRDINNLNNIDFIIVSGDITATGSLEELSLSKSILDSLKKPYHIIPGNHDTKWSESGCTDFIKLWGNDRFIFEKEGILFIGLHEGPRMRMADGHFAPEDLRWFDSVTKDLRDTNQPIIFFTHYPLDKEIANWFEILDRLKTLNTQAVLFGHGHTNKYYNFEGIPGIMDRSNLRSKDEIGGYNIVEIQKDSVYFAERISGIETKHIWATVPLHLKKRLDFEPNQSRPDYSLNEKYPNVKTIWEYNTGYTIGSSAVVNDKDLFVGDASGMFYSINLTDGELNWKFKTGNAIYSSPVIQKDYIVFGSADSSIYCLKTEDGSEQWHYQTNAAVLGCPIIKDDKVYIGASDRHFRAFNIESGNIIWDFSGLQGFVETKPVIYNYKVLFGSWDENFYCLDINAGSLLWKWRGDKEGTFYSPAACWPVVSDETVFFAAPDRKLTAIDIDSGKEAWRTGKYKVRETVGLSEDGKKLFIRTMNDSIICIPATKNLREPFWITNCGFDYDISSAQIVEKDGMIFYPTKNGMIYALDSDTGKIIWQYKISNGYVNTITPISHNKIIATDFDGKIILLQSNFSK
jgi:outer membrane protein assembly factor BamB/predicted phosphodiesterase